MAAIALKISSRGDHLLCRHGVCKPGVTLPCSPKRREQRATLQHPYPREVGGEEAGYLGEGEDEEQVEEELQGGDPLFAPDPGWRHTFLIGEVHGVHLLSLS
jgi:hypothetical protein